MITYLLAQAIIAAFNLLNAVHDASRIRLHKRIYHGVNLGVYTLICGLLCWRAGWNAGVITLFCISAFCNRQLSFDIPLNVFRGLNWDYVTKAKPPKAMLDRIEIRLFGYNGRAPVVCYALVWFACMIIMVWL